MMKKLLATVAILAVAGPFVIQPAAARDRYDDGYDGGRYEESYDGRGSYRCDLERSDIAIGTTIGAIAGGAIGNQFGRGDGRVAATIAGVILGGLIGNRIASDDARCDNDYVQDTYYRSFERGRAGHRYRWRNPHTGHYGYVTPASYYQDGYGRNCREFEQTIYVDGRRQTATGTACRQRDGTWRIVD